MAEGGLSHVHLVPVQQLLHNGVEGRKPHQPMLPHHVNDVTLVEWNTGAQNSPGRHAGRARL